MALTDLAIRRTKARDRAYKLYDEKGLYLLVSTTGARLWRLKYRVAGKEKTLALGVYPERSLVQARDDTYDARKLIRGGVDPSAQRKEEKRERRIRAENTFEILACEWHANQCGKWTTGHAKTMLRRLQTHLFPALGKRPIAEIEAPELLDAFRGIEREAQKKSRGSNEIAHRMLQASGQIFRYAIATGRARRDPSGDLRGALKAKEKTRNLAALSEADLPDFLKNLHAYDGTPQTKLALRLLLLTFVRTGELRGAQWAEFELDKAQWRIPAERMKMRSEHIVPLSTQSIAVIKELHRLNDGRRWVFGNQADHEKPMSENTLLYALYRMGYHSRATAHGFRATASTILNEQGFRADVIERQLAHVERNKVRAAYHRTEYLIERRQMMQHWADFLDGLSQRC
ncbi:MAG TPA: integrase arm-type DNA-binding domain-containing protein [Casimicrobiaceae bacterium]|jgi:integrase|nr:integrase arm-type DNA-binding domain-containing protein [Casimicrobiaceae bacterium]